MKFRFKNSWVNHFQILILLIGASLFLFSSCTNTSATLSKNEMKEIVDKQNEILGKYFKEGDAENLARMYTDSAKLSPNGSRFIIGRDSIQAFWQADFKTSKLLKMETHTMTIDGNENFIYETGNTFSDILYNNSVYHVKVKYINVWRKQPQGDYKLDVDFWNGDAE